MKAMLITGFGGPEVFELREMPKPEPGPCQILVKVHATSVNPVDYKIRQAGAWAGIKPPAIIGYDVSGVVEDLGDGVEDFQVGDEVYYTPEIFEGQGGYAEYHVAHQAIVARKPSNLSHVEAASIPLAGGTAWDALITRANLHVGETVLIHGAGGVG
jgi:NADPH2:quinone reductase